MASNILEKSEDELRQLQQAGLGMLYIGPESGDDRVLHRIAKGSTAQEHVDAAQRAKAAGLRTSVIFLLGAEEWSIARTMPGRRPSWRPRWIRTSWRR